MTSMQRLAALAALSAGALSLTACGLSPRAQDTAIGAGVGGVVGSVVTGGSTAGTVGGAVIGGAIGNQNAKDKGK
jgi:osmotically inducible lipoprotein OsmB